MKPPGFPFPALVGLEPLKLALQLAAIDVRLSVLIRGDKGAGKSTAARALVDLLEPGAPFVNLPIGATEDRLLGGLDVEKALKGEPALKRGLLADANGGVLYLDEVNLLPDHLADALLGRSRQRRSSSRAGRLQRGAGRGVRADRLDEPGRRRAAAAAARSLRARGRRHGADGAGDPARGDGAATGLRPRRAGVCRSLAR